MMSIRRMLALGRSFTSQRLSRMTVVVPTLPAVSALSALSATPSFLCFSSTTTPDPASKLLQGVAKINDLSIKELQQSLEVRGLSFDDCFDRMSLQKRLAASLVAEERTVNSNTQTWQGIPGQESDNFPEDLLPYIPWYLFGIKKDVFGGEKDVVVAIPFWEFERLGAWEKNYGRAKHVPLRDVAAIREIVVQGLADYVAFNMHESNYIDNAYIGTAVALLYLRSSRDGIETYDTIEGQRDIRLKVLAGQVTVISALHKVPKNWVLPGLEDMPPKIRDKTLRAIQCVRDNVGESEDVDW